MNEQILSWPGLGIQACECQFVARFGFSQTMLELYLYRLMSSRGKRQAVNS